MMRKITVCFLLLFLGMPLGAAFKDRAWSPRAAGQGGAFAAQDDDTAAIFYNPAGAAFIQQREAGFMYSRPFLGLDGVELDKEYAVACMPSPAGVFGLSWSSLGANSIYREDAYSCTFARDVSSLLSPFIGARQSVALGANLKYLVHGYTLDARTAGDPVFAAGRTKGGFTGDAGVLYRQVLSAVSSFNIGAGFKNIIPPDIGLASGDIVPLETRLGASFYTVSLPKVCSLNVAADVVERAGETSVYAGGECWLVPAFGLRAGMNTTEYSFGISGDLSLARLEFRVDYTFLWPLAVEETNGSHSMAFVVRF